MFKLITLEMKRHKISKFIPAVLIASLIILLFAYFFAFVTKVRPEAAANTMLLTYDYVFMMMDLFSLICFSIISAIVFSHLIIDDYKDEFLYIMFLYPIKRKKIFFAKIIYAILLVFGFSLISQMVIYGIFIVAEHLVPVMTSDNINDVDYMSIAQNVLVVSLQSAIIGILSMKIGFIKRSVPVTIVVAIGIAFILCNLFTLTSMLIVWIITFVLLILAIVVTIWQGKVIEKLQPGKAKE